LGKKRYKKVKVSRDFVQIKNENGMEKLRVVSADQDPQK
jgi:hypothetical protein